MPVTHPPPSERVIERVSRVYSDGGCMGGNPSKTGGAWAYCWVDPADTMIHSIAHVVTPEEIGLPTVSNNVTELLGLLNGLEPLPDGWAGHVYTDSLCTLLRFRRSGEAFSGVPPELERRVREVRSRLGLYTLTLLAGHPSKKHLETGFKNGRPVSKHNRWCDKACQGAMRAWDE